MIKIGFKNYVVAKVDCLNDGCNVLFGEIDYSNGVIRISNNYSKEIQECTLIHEILHGVDDIAQTNLTEDQITKLSKVLYPVLRDNGNLFETLK